MIDVSMNSGTSESNKYGDGTLVVIENPIFTDSAFSKSSRSGDEVDLSKLLVANKEQGGYLTVLSASVSALSDNQLKEYQL